MKERPILFSGPMVRAILADRKTQTRRVVKTQPGPEWNEIICGHYVPTKINKRTGEEYPGEEVFGFADADNGWICPYGQPGDRLWVREKWKPTGLMALHPTRLSKLCGEFAYAADENQKERNRLILWRPSIHMPRWASRITLEVTSVRVERVQEISESDAIAEGVEPNINSGYVNYLWHGNDDITQKQIDSWPWQYSNYHDAKGSFSSLWEKINAQRGYGWDVNPWVWAVEFKRITA